MEIYEGRIPSGDLDRLGRNWEDPKLFSLAISAGKIKLATSMIGSSYKKRYGILQDPMGDSISEIYVIEPCNSKGFGAYIFSAKDKDTLKQGMAANQSRIVSKKRCNLAFFTRNYKSSRISGYNKSSFYHRDKGYAIVVTDANCLSLNVEGRTGIIPCDVNLSALSKFLDMSEKSLEFHSQMQVQANGDGP